MWLIVFSTTIR
jgi:hypothetical protein